MSDHVFYAKARSGNVRILRIRSAALLSPKQNKRIKMNVTMGLSNQKKVGAPEWIINALEFVLKNQDPVHPAVSFKGYEITLATEQNNLFEDKALQATSCDLKGFIVSEEGRGDDKKDVVCYFTIIAPFSSRLWTFVSQNAGDDIQCAFVAGAAPPDDDQLELTSDEGEEEEDEAEDAGEDND